MLYLISLAVVGVVSVAACLASGAFDSLRHLGLTFTILVPIGVVWDSIAVKMGWWSFSPEYIVGIMVGPLPVEEVVFIVAVPLLSIGVYELTRTR